MYLYSMTLRLLSALLVQQEVGTTSCFLEVLTVSRPTTDCSLPAPEELYCQSYKVPDHRVFQVYIIIPVY